MRPITLPPLTAEQLKELSDLYRTTRDARLRTRVQMVLLAVEKGMVAREIGDIVRENEQTVRLWLKRYMAEGVEGLRDRPRSGTPPKVTDGFKDALLKAVRRRPRSLNLEFSMWTLQRLAEYLAVETGIRISDETIRKHLKTAGITLSRPQHKVSSPDPEYELKKRRLKRCETPSSPEMSSTMPTSST